LADSLGLLATGSSDYHGTGKLNHDLGCNTTDPEVFDEIQRRLARADSSADRPSPPLDR
jgi:3',5'-nucleoside bisphosphate phosphatase